MRTLILYFAEHTLVLGALVIFIVLSLWWLKFQKQLNMKWHIAPILAAFHVVVGTAAMKLLAVLEVGGDWEAAASLRLIGAIYALPPLYYLGARLTRRNVPLVMDISAICLVVGLVVGRINCLLSGCCQGFCIVPGGTARWPLREIELVFYLAFIAYFSRKTVCGKSNGMATPVFYLAYGLLRFLLEWLREEYTGSIGILHLAHLWSLMLLAIGIIWCYQVIQYNKTGRKPIGKNSGKQRTKEDKK